MSDNPTTTGPNRPGIHTVNIRGEVQVPVYIGHNIRVVVTDSNASDQNARNSNVEIQERGITELQINVDNRVRNTDQGNAATSPLGPIRPARPARPTRPAIYSTAATLLGFLPSVGLDALPDDSKNCIVCQEHYAGQDMPVKLQCSHVVGRECIEKWILGGHHTCPLCRQAMFEPDEGTVVVD